MAINGLLNKALRTCPITESLVEAFCTAILAFDDWTRGDPKPQVFLDGRPDPALARTIELLRAEIDLRRTAQTSKLIVTRPKQL